MRGPRPRACVTGRQAWHHGRKSTNEGDPRPMTANKIDDVRRYSRCSARNRGTGRPLFINENRGHRVFHDAPEFYKQNACISTNTPLWRVRDTPRPNAARHVPDRYSVAPRANGRRLHKRFASIHHRDTIACRPLSFRLALGQATDQGRHKCPDRRQSYLYPGDAEVPARGDWFRFRRRAQGGPLTARMAGRCTYSR